MTQPPKMSPLEVLKLLIQKGEFKESGFNFSYGECPMGGEDAPVAEDKEGNLFFASGELGDPVTESTIWIEG